MDKLQYDSFYKFMVSAGVVLIAAPLVGLYYFLCNGNRILISNAEYNALSASSIQFLKQRDRTILFILEVLPWLLGGLIVIGLICLIYGGVKWHNIQKEIDTQTKLKTQEQKINIEKLSTPEILAKTMDEVTDEYKNQANTDSNIMLGKHIVVKAIEIENLCYSYILRQQSRAYDIQQNVKFNNYACDMLAISKKDKIDYLYEVKYWTNIHSFSIIHHVIVRMEEMRTSYETQFQRCCKCILLIVTVDEMKISLRKYCDEYLSKNPVSTDIHIYVENDLIDRENMKRNQ